MIDNNSDRKFFGSILMMIGGALFFAFVLSLIANIFGMTAALCFFFLLTFFSGAWLRFKK